MQLMNIFAMSLATHPSAFGTSLSHKPHPRPTPTFDLFFLRINATNEPYHNRHVIELPTTGSLGLENFTIHPPTPPLLFTPVELHTGNYALRGSYQGDDLSQTPYIAALAPSSAGHAGEVAMELVYLPDPTEPSFGMSTGACPEGFECKADGWSVRGIGKDGVLEGFGLTGSEGMWEVDKDAGRGGWIIRWKENVTYHSVQLDIVPYQGIGWHW